MHISCIEMHTEQNRILALNPGSRYLGMAVFYGADLREWRLRGLHQGSFEKRLSEAQSLVSEIVTRFAVRVLAIKTIPNSKSSHKLKLLVSHLRKIGELLGLKVFEFSVNEMKRFFFHGAAANKRMLMEEMAAQYPFLFKDLERQRKCKSQYLIRVFEAIALGAVCWSELEGARSKVVRCHS